MFLSKITVFLLAILAAAGLGIALTMPRPAQRRLAEAQEDSLSRARGDLDLLLRWDARRWVDLAAGFGRVAPPPTQPKLRLDTSLEEASRGDEIGGATQATVRDTLAYIVGQISGAQKPEFVLAVDKWGRVASTFGSLERRPGEDLSGYFIVQDVLRGYMRDDLWFEGGKLYRIAAAPVVERGRGEYVGAVLLGDEVDLTLCQELAGRVNGDIAFFVRGQSVAASATVPTQDLVDQFGKLADKLDEKDERGRSKLNAFDVEVGDDSYRAALRKLPGEAGAMDGFVAVLIKQPPALGFVGTLQQMSKDDIGWGRFPWIPLGAAFLLALAAGMAVLWIEGDRPARKLADDAVALGKGDKPKLAEELHRGKLGAVARSVNVAIEKLEREAREKRKDLGAVLGPAPQDSVLSAPAPKAAPPPPSQFVFSDQKKGAPPTSSGGHGGISLKPGYSAQDDFDPGALAAATDALMPARAAAPASAPAPALPPVPKVPSRIEPGAGIGAPRAPAPPPMARAATPPPAPPRTPPPIAKTPPPMAAAAAAAFDLDAPQAVDEVANLSSGIATSANGDDEGAFQRVFEDYFALKQQCGEQTEGLTFEKFAVKLRKNRDELVSKYACRSVKFQVYIKDGKAALKATPVKA